MANTLLTTITTLSMVVSLQTYAQDIQPPNNYSEMLETNTVLELKYKEVCPIELTTVVEDTWAFRRCIMWSNTKDSRSDFLYYSTSEDLERARNSEANFSAAIAELDQKWAAEKAARDELAKKPGVRIGMTTDQVINETSWGRPEYTNRTTTAAGVNEQWVYGLRSYLYFNNGILVSIQN